MMIYISSDDIRMHADDLFGKYGLEAMGYFLGSILHV